VTSRRGAAVLGSPIAHSLSPVLHRAAYDALGLDGWSYRAVECTPADLAATLTELAGEDLAGVSLTMPLKSVVMPLLAAHDSIATEVGAANTVIFGNDGTWSGANTDVPGLMAALRGSGLLATSDPPWVLGAGATAGAALAALGRLGYRAAVVVARRTTAAEQLRPIAARAGVEVAIRDWSEIAGAAAASLVLSTTPAGATDGFAAALSEPPGGGTLGVLFDVVYSPWPTALAAAWQSGGGQVVGGIELLIEQAGEQVRLMTGREAPLAQMRAAGRDAIGRSAVGSANDH
jgi:shikimate dehydrogenase